MTVKDELQDLLKQRYDKHIKNLLTTPPSWYTAVVKEFQKLQDAEEILKTNNMPPLDDLNALTLLKKRRGRKKPRI